MAKKFKVREQFAVIIGKDVYRAGDIVELTDEQVELHALKIEEVAQVKASPKVEAEPKPEPKAKAGK